MTIGENVVAAGESMNDDNSLQVSSMQDMTCVHCCYPGVDVVFSCSNQCSYHARCLDLVSVQQICLTVSMATEAGGGSCKLNTCLNCRSPASTLEILPLALDTIKIGRSEDGSSSSVGKRSFQASSLQSSQGYDLNTPRTGRWVPSEITFRDALLSHFTTGSLPLRDEYKLLDFLSDILKSKQSRLTKKMKHANLSVQHYCYLSGFLPKHQAAELSKMEHDFVCSLPDHEQNELKFHMARLWREHLADRLSLTMIPFDPNRWIDSVEILERRLNDKQEQERMVKRRIMMGKAWTVDSNLEEGVFVDGVGTGIDIDFDYFISSMESESGTRSNLAGDAEIKSIFSSFANGTERKGSGATSDTSGEEYQSSFVEHGSSTSSAEPNFRFAAPFLAWIISYMERTHMPFEHVDIWCPSSLPNGICGSMAPPTTTLGSGSSVDPDCRLFFAGSASSSKQMLSSKNDESLGKRSSLTPTPMSSDEVESLSLFGHYSEKFSFSIGCGLPGRVFQSGQPEWSHFLSNASPSSFERRGGAMQFGIQTAVALPIKCANVGQIVLAFYSRNIREQNDELIERIIKDVQAMNPCPRFKLIVDMGEANDSNPADVPAALSSAMSSATAAFTAINSAAPPMANQYPYNPAFSAAPPPPSNLAEALHQAPASNLAQVLGETQTKTRALIAFICENMPSNNDASPLSSQVNNIMALRLLLLKPNCSPEEQHLVDSMLLLFESYLTAQRSPVDITMMLARDFSFHDLQLKQSTMANEHVRQQQSPPHHIVPMPFERSNSVPYMSLDHSNHSLPPGSLCSLRGHMSSFSLNSVDHSKAPM
ncbi:hypothetical protein ACHAWO_011249 [Cyclotella atomus]|uniref:Transcription factor MYC/MYB N-terminal domain-containing protein n=1 Tax=Cyclotella atomus TaxID=382360 RepID=A0ABD3PB47_9STRA